MIQRAVDRGLSRSASIWRRTPDLGGDRVGQPVEHGGQAGAAAAGPEDQGCGDQVAGGVVEVVGERTQRRLGGPPGAQPHDQTIDLGLDGGGSRALGGDQRLLQAHAGGQHPGQRPGPLGHRVEPFDRGPGRGSQQVRNAQAAAGTATSAMNQPVSSNPTRPPRTPTTSSVPPLPAAVPPTPPHGVLRGAGAARASVQSDDDEQESAHQATSRLLRRSPPPRASQSQLRGEVVRQVLEPGHPVSPGSEQVVIASPSPVYSTARTSET